MPATTSGSARGPFASAAALYSQHLGRPPSAYTLVSGSGRKGRRRPRSASTATTRGPGQSTVPHPPPPASVSPNGNTRIDHETPLPQPAVRPASAAAVGEARPHPTASRPSRSRPATATGMAYAHRSNVLHHQRSNVVKGPAWGYDKERGDGTEAEVPAGEPARRDPAIGAEAAAGSDYWHECKPLEVNPAVMRRAEEFVARILRAKREGQLPKAQQPNGPPTSQPEAARRAHQGFEHPQTGSNAGPLHDTKTGRGIVKSNRVCHAGRGQRLRGRQNIAASTTSAGTRVTNKSIPTRTSRRLATKTKPVNTRKLKSRRQLEARSIVSADSSKFPFPPSGSNRGIGNASAEDVTCFAHFQPSPAAEDVAGGDGGGNNGSSLEQEDHRLVVMTPLSLDVFCSMRPTLSTQISNNQRRQKTTGTSEVVDLSAAVQENNQRKGSRPNRKAGRRHCERDESHENQPLSVWGGPSVGDITSRRPPRAWASIFGAVCAGAERGRARAEVLEAARRESLRQSKRRRSAAGGSAADSRAKLGHPRDTPAFPETVVRHASTAVTPVSSAMGAADPCCSLPTDEAVTACVEGPVAEKPTARGEGSCEKVRGDAEGEGTRPSTLQEPRKSGVQWTHEADIADSSQACDVDKGSSPSHDVSVEVRGAFTRDTCNPSTPQNSPARPIAGDHVRHPPCTAGTTPLFRHPFGGGTTRVSVNAPRSLQVCPGERGFDGSNASKTSRHCFSLPRKGHVVQGQQPSATGLRRPVARRPSTAGSDACAAIVATCGTGGGVGDGEHLGGLDKKGGAGPRPETAGSFFSRSDSGRSKLVGAANRGSASPRWTNGECLRRQVDRILDTFSSNNIQFCDSARQAVEKQGGVDDTADGATHATEAWSRTHKLNVVHAKSDIPDNSAQEPDRGPSASEVSGVLHSTDYSGSKSQAVVEPAVESEVDGAATGSTTRRGSKQDLGRGGEADGAPGIPTTSAVNAVQDNPVVSGSIISGDVDSSGLSTYRGLSRLLPRPSSAPPDACVAVRSRRSASSPGLMQRVHNTVGSFATAEAESKGITQYSDRCGPNAIPGETGSDVVGDCGTEMVDGGACPTCTPCAVVDGTASLGDVRDARDPPVPDRGHDHAERGNGGGDSVSAEKNHDTRLNSAHMGHACLAAGVPKDHAYPSGRGHVTAGAIGHDNVAVRADGLNEGTSLEASSAAASVGVETRLDFAKATVKLKVMAAEASVAVDEHDEAWGVSKEKAEVLFNDLRLAPEEDAQQSGNRAASETRNRLQRIMVESGVENSRRVRKEADLEELRRVLLQDTTMYAARKSASDRLHEAVKTLEAENDSCDHLQVLECRRGRSLSMLRERTERDKDGLRAACRRRREEAGAMGVTLAEARHAHGRLLGHVQHLVERLSCLAEYVNVMRRWCQEHLESRRHARITSKAINVEFGRKSE
ncbi:unnamed protein product, partial [Scytosiphon promiscuus]